MREILFRGAQKVDGAKSLIWYEGSLVIETDGYTGEKEYYIQNENGSYLVIPETVGQYTGLTDKNGKKIFEGDIVKTKKYGKIVNHSNVNDYDIFVVAYELCLFRLVNKYRGFNLIDDGYSKLEKIGNIHDNPELLEVSE